MHRLAWVLGLLLALSVLFALAGCGGGGSSSSRSVGRVSGNVFLGDGASSRATSAITVSLEGTRLSARATADGRFVIEKVPTGLHTLVARSGGYAVAAVVRVEQGAETSVGDLVLTEAGQISGLVTSASNGNPIANAEVTVTNLVETTTDTMQPLPVRMATTDRLGSYTVSGLPAGSYVVTVEKKGYVAASVSVDVSAGTTTPGDVQLTPGSTGGAGAMSGVVTVTTDTGSEPLAGVLVQVFPAGDTVSNRSVPGGARKGGRCEGEYYAYTDDTGAYTIDGIEAGSYVAYASRPGFSEASAEVAITAGQTLKRDFVLEQNKVQIGTVEGIVRDSVTGTPIAGAVVGLRMAYAYAERRSARSSGGRCEPAPIYIPPGDVDVTTTTDAEGHYNLRVPAGGVEIFAQANGYQLLVQTVEVTADQTTTQDLALVAWTGEKVTLSGTVVTKDSGGALKPVAGAEVTIGRLDDPYVGVDCPLPRPDLSYTATTGDDGKFSLTVVTGEYWISAWAGDLGGWMNASVNADTDVSVELGEVWAL